MRRAKINRTSEEMLAAPLLEFFFFCHNEAAGHCVVSMVTQVLWYMFEVGARGWRQTG